MKILALQTLPTRQKMTLISKGVGTNVEDDLEKAKA